VDEYSSAGGGGSEAARAAGEARGAAAHARAAVGDRLAREAQEAEDTAAAVFELGDSVTCSFKGRPAARYPAVVVATEAAPVYR
jgi:hypothetical protein